MDVVLAVAAVIAGLYFLEAAAERFVDAIGGLSRRLRASEGAVGLLTAGGEWEELVVVVFAIISGHPGLAVGNVIGSCLANLIGSMPLGLLAKRPLAPDRSARVYGVFLIAVTILVILLSLSGRVTPLGGGVLVLAFAAYVLSVLFIIWRGWLKTPPTEAASLAAAPERPSLVLLVSLGISLAIICGAAEAVVLGASHIARVVGLSEYAIGATIVAIGTTLPDKAISLVAGRAGQGGVVTSNALGSNIFLLTLVLGVAALASAPGLQVPTVVRQVDLPLLLAVSAIVALLLRRSRLHWRVGLALLAAYGAYLAFALIRG